MKCAYLPRWYEVDGLPYVRDRSRLIRRDQTPDDSYAIDSLSERAM